LNGHLAALLVDDKLNSTHGLIVALVMGYS
jgi:hypothetical protein